MTQRFRKVFVPFSSVRGRLTLLLESGGKRNVYTLPSAELRAQEHLREKLSEQQWGSYIVSDAFAEVGRSGIVYLLRKNRPTLALGYPNEEGIRQPLCTLCLHPLGYYLDTWVGVMPPSDEVLTHLLMIRASEHRFWRQANQIPLHSPESGV